MTDPATPPLYLDDAGAVERFAGSIARERQLAVDTEGASFHRFHDRIYLLQISTRDRTAVIDPLPIGTPTTLGGMLEDAKVEIVFHDADYDLRLLAQDYGWHVRNIFDTRIAAQLAGIRAFGLAALLDRYFGLKLEKKHQRADWSMRPLTADMLEYAAQDTHFLLGLRDRLADELEGMGRMSWAREEFARLEGTTWPPEDPAGAFLRLKGARDLDRRELALLRELVPWRDAVAREADRATFRIMSNDTLLEVARTAPETREDLARIKGMPRGLLERRADEILDAVRRGVAVPDDALPRFPRAARWDRDPDFDARVSALKTVRDAAAQRLGLDPGVAASRERLESIARRRPETLEEIADIPEIRRWQIEEMGEEWLRALRGVAGGAPPSPASTAADDSPYREE